MTVMKNIARNSRGQFVLQTPVNSFVQAMRVEGNYGLTEKGALTNKSTLSSVLDFFGAGGAIRSRSEPDVINLFSKAFSEDRLLATRILFYLRDVREGQGERKTFRTLVNWLANFYTDVARKNLENIAFYGRWDDLYALMGTPLEQEVYALFAKQLKEDLRNTKKGESISLLAKWLKSENTSSRESRKLGHNTREALELTPKRYRRILSTLRKYIDVLEVKMCAGQWAEVDFEHVPSKASLNYRKAFGRHDQARYAAYLESVKKGEKKMNASAIYPYEILRSIIRRPYGSGNLSPQEALQADLQWKSMPNWLEGNEHYGLVIADVSGSMFTCDLLPILVSVSLAIYFAERNIGPFKDMWMTFSGSPTFQKLVGNNLLEKFNNMDKSNWAMNTDLQAAFNAILQTALQNNVSQKDMPTCLYIVSDMEHDQACRGNNATNADIMKRKFAAAGYQLPRVVWWNVAARNEQFPIRLDEDGMALVSGASPSILKSLLSAKSFDPMSIVYEVTNNPRYERVVV
jgi:hypothetical protein